MKRLLSAAACVALVMGTSAWAQNQQQQNQRRDQDQPRERSQQAEQQQQGQQQTITGTVAGVTSVGEAVIDPQTGTAVAVTTNYLTVLGSPAGGQRGQRGRQSETDRADQADRTPGQRGQGRRQQANRGQQNLYLIAITPQTTIREGGRQAGQEEQQQQQQQAQSAFEKLEIGDRVMVQFESAERLQAKAQEGEQRVAGFRGDARNKHGRNRIYIGKASSIQLRSAEAGFQRRPGAERRQGAERRPDAERQQQREREGASDN